MANTTPLSIAEIEARKAKEALAVRPGKKRGNAQRKPTSISSNEVITFAGTKKKKATVLAHARQSKRTGAVNISVLPEQSLSPSSDTSVPAAMGQRKRFSTTLKAAQQIKEHQPKQSKGKSSGSNGSIPCDGEKDCSHAKAGKLCGLEYLRSLGGFGKPIRQALKMRTGTNRSQPTFGETTMKMRPRIESRKRRKNAKGTENLAPVNDKK